MRESGVLGRWIPLAIAFGAPIAVLALVRTFVIDVPFLDEWQWTPMIVHSKLGVLSWNDIWPLHNEQRIVVPSLVALGLAAIRHNWVITRETTLSVSIVFATLAVWWAVIGEVVPAPRRAWALALVSLLLSSLTQAENWTWGFQMSFFIANLCAAIIGLSFIMSERQWSLPIAVAALIIATHSIGIGLSATLGGIVFYAMTRQPRKLLTWTAISVLIAILYKHDFQAALYRPFDAPLLTQFVMIVKFVLIVLGAPIARSAGRICCGLVGATAIVVLTLYALTVLTAKVRSRTPTDSAALIALGLVAVCGAIEVAYGRLFDGLDAALGGRFTTPMSLLWITIVLVASRLDGRRSRLAFVGALPLLGLWVASQIGGYAEFEDRTLSLFAAAQVIPRWDKATEDEFPPLWPAEAFLGQLHAVRDGPFGHP
jgi:hypothetical protein